MSAFKSSRWSLCCFSTSVLLVCGASALAQFNVGAGAIAPLFQTPPPNPDPDLYPTDFIAAPPNWMDTSGVLPWPLGANTNGLEPGPHDYSSTFHTIFLANASSSDRYKLVWMHLQFNTGTPPQMHGAPFNPSSWADSLGGGGTATPTGAAWEQSAGVLHIYQTWKIVPQPSSENIYLNNLLAAVGRAQPDAIWTQTICVLPEPALSIVAGLAFVTFARRR